MAKISKINIAITGDSKGLAAATDAAARDLRRLNAAADRSTKQLGDMKGKTNQVAEGLAKMGAQSRALGAVGGVLGLASLGPAGLAMGAAGLGLAGLTGAAGLGLDAIQGIPAMRKRAIDALEETRMDQRKRIEDYGLTQRLAEGLAANGKGPNVANQLGFMGGLSAGLGSMPGSVMQTAIQSGPGALGVYAGRRLGGDTAAGAQQAAMETVFGENKGSQLAGVTQFAFDLVNADGPIGWFREAAKWMSK